MTTKKLILGALESPVIMGVFTLVVIYYTWLIFISFYGWVCKIADQLDRENNKPD